MELFKRCIRQSVRYGNLIAFITERLEDSPVNKEAWSTGRSAVECFREELRERFALEVNVDKKKELKPYILLSAPDKYPFLYFPEKRVTCYLFK